MTYCKMIAIDASTKSSGVSIWENGKLINSFLIDCKEEKNIDERLKDMSLKLLSCLCKEKPSIVYIEETVVNRNVQVQRFLTRLQGVIFGYCIKNDCEFNTIRPTEWRSLVHMAFSRKKRPELKQMAIDMVKGKYGIDVSDDIAEAILIGEAAINKYSNIDCGS